MNKILLRPSWGCADLILTMWARSKTFLTVRRSSELTLTVIIGLVIASAFPAIVVYAQELLPGRVGMISGLFFGFAFGMGGIGAAILGRIADATSILFVYKICAWLPAIGLLAGFLPNTKGRATDFNLVSD